MLTLYQVHSCFFQLFEINIFPSHVNSSSFVPSEFIDRFLYKRKTGFQLIKIQLCEASNADWPEFVNHFFLFTFFLNLIGSSYTAFSNSIFLRNNRTSYLKLKTGVRLYLTGCFLTNRNANARSSDFAVNASTNQDTNLSFYVDRCLSRQFLDRR